MSAERLLTTMANEIEPIIRQIESSDPALRSAALMRLRDFAQMLAPWRSAALNRPVTRRGFLRAGATFAAMSLKRDD